MTPETAVTVLSELIQGYHRRLPAPRIAVSQGLDEAWLNLWCGPVSISLGKIASKKERPWEMPEPFRAKLASVNEQLTALCKEFT